MSARPSAAACPGCRSAGPGAVRSRVSRSPSPSPGPARWSWPELRRGPIRRRNLYRVTMRRGACRGLALLAVLVVEVAPGRAAADVGSVSISGMAFNPPTLEVHAGDTVTWTNNDQVSHSVTADDGSFDSSAALCRSTLTVGCVQPGRTYVHNFN